MSRLRSTLVTAAAVGAAAIGGTTIADAANSSSSTATTPSAASAGTPSAQPGGHDPSKGRHTVNGKTETLLTGDTATEVRAAALAKVSGIVERVETNVDSSAPYEAHIRKADGTEVEVQVNSDLTVSAVNTMSGRHP